MEFGTVCLFFFASMVEKQILSKHYQELINHVLSFKDPSLDILQAHFSQIHARLNPQSTLLPKEYCPGCHVSRKDENQERVQEPPITKNQNKRFKQIQKLRKVKRRSKKQENMLKKLLMRKNGFQKITCKLCGYIVKFVVSKEETRDTQLSTKQPVKQQTKSKQTPSEETLTLKKEKKKTAGLNPLYVKPKMPAKMFEGHSFNHPKNVQKLSQLLQTSNNKNNATSHSNRLNLLLE